MPGRELFSVADEFREMEDDDDEETREWEMAQARRAGGWPDEVQAKPEKPSYRSTPSMFSAGNRAVSIY